MARQIVLAGLCLSLTGSLALGQTQVTVTTPNTTVHSDFSEQVRVGFDLHYRSFNLRFGRGATSGLGGGFTPSLGGTSIGIPLRGGSLNGNISILAGQSSSRGITTTAPILTTLDGVAGSMFGGTIQPFVVAIVPVAGSAGPVTRPAPVSLLQHKLMLGEIPLEEDETGQKRVRVPDLPQTRAPSKPQTNTPDSSNLFRREIEKYAGAKL